MVFTKLLLGRFLRSGWNFWPKLERETHLRVAKGYSTHLKCGRPSLKSMFCLIQRRVLNLGLYIYILGVV